MCIAVTPSPTPTGLAARRSFTVMGVTDRIEQAGLDRSEAAEMRGNLDTLVNSKQKGRNLAELSVLVMLAFLVASAVTFMTVHLFDRRSEHDLPLIADAGKVMFRTATRTEEHNRIVEQTISVGIGFAVIGIYIWLMILKWLPV